MTIFHSNAVLVEDSNNTRADEPSLCLADDMKRGYCSCPVAHSRDMQADGISVSAQRVYTAISQRQQTLKGECFRSNAGLGEELGLHRVTVSKAIQELKAKNYLSVWFVNGGRRLRVLVPALRGGSHHTSGGKSQDCTDNENNKKKTTQPKKCVFSFSEKDRALFGGVLEELVASHSVDDVMRGIRVVEATDNPRNPQGLLKDAVRNNWQPTKKKAEAFPTSLFDHDKIIHNYLATNPDKVGLINSLRSDGLDEGRVESAITSSIAYKIWADKI